MRVGASLVDMGQAELCRKAPKAPGKWMFRRHNGTWQWSGGGGQRGCDVWTQDMGKGDLGGGGGGGQKGSVRVLVG